VHGSPRDRERERERDRERDDYRSGAHGPDSTTGSTTSSNGGQRKRVSVDMLIAETLDGSAPASASTQVTPSSAQPPSTSSGEGWYESAGAAPSTNGSANSGAGAGAGGMSVIDVGTDGDKKKRLNRQSANYGSKAVACVHCRGDYSSLLHSKSPAKNF